MKEKFHNGLRETLNSNMVCMEFSMRTSMQRPIKMLQRKKNCRIAQLLVIVKTHSLLPAMIPSNFVVWRIQVRKIWKNCIIDYTPWTCIFSQKNFFCGKKNNVIRVNFKNANIVAVNTSNLLSINGLFSKRLIFVGQKYVSKN